MTPSLGDVWWFLSESPTNTHICACARFHVRRLRCHGQNLHACVIHSWDMHAHL
jgi:hypothetical protein